MVWLVMRLTSIDISSLHKHDKGDGTEVAGVTGWVLFMNQDRGC